MPINVLEITLSGGMTIGSISSIFNKKYFTFAHGTPAFFRKLSLSARKRAVCLITLLKLRKTKTNSTFVWLTEDDTQGIGYILNY